MSARLFVAVALGGEDRAALAGWAAAAVGADAGLRVVGAAQLHLTLVFLGHRRLDEVAALAELVALREGAPAPALRTAGALWLPPRRPTVLAVAVEDLGGRLEALYAGVWADLGALGHEPPRRGLRPHVTVARVRRGWSAPAAPPHDPPARALRAEGLELVRSRLGGGPARYETLSRATFAAES
ncbi:RNA 2',3'-cyclic phosphodiesterase [Baekduia soli]|uniref:RNA 2',3'-cyclic phosphodiesterase n=1 Tax=Baekduia soli TaxID=496014 RepID=UPI0016528C5C|nr:RNA 2',3'-cyclic phosphodiesterase [Baekduia soli]